MRAELKAKYGLTAQQIHSNLTYLESQGWVKDDPITKSVMTRAGGVIPSTTSYFVITAAGIYRIGGPSMFTRDRFKGIRIEATGQNIITLGDGNQVNAKFQDIGESLVELRRAIKESDSIDEMQKMELVVDVDTLQTQLAKPTPNRELISRMWEGINRAASIAGLAEAAHQSVNSRAEHFTSFCENSDPMLARTAAGCQGSSVGPSKKMPVTPAASAVRMMVPRFPGESIDSTASQSSSAAKAVSILIACGTAEQAAEKVTKACCTVVERRFSAA